MSFFAEYNFSVEYKSGRLNFVDDALSRRPDFEPTAQSNSGDDPTVAALSVSVSSSSRLDDVREAYAEDESLLRLMGYVTNPPSQSFGSLTSEYRSMTDRYTVRDGLLDYIAVNGDTPRVVIPTHHDFRLRIHV